MYSLAPRHFWSHGTFAGTHKFPLLTWHPEQEQLHLGPGNVFEQTCELSPKDNMYLGVKAEPVKVKGTK